jgi:Cu(I)/Ag(I) efflux system membrane fusion protein/cobalt-zinc-cadmium efflux system membrane fusion protein
MLPNLKKPDVARGDSRKHFPGRILVLSLALGLLLSGGFSLFRNISGSIAGHSSQAVGHAYASDAKYTCGMHPMVILDEPGSCPICGMDLVPLKQDGAGSAAQTSGERKIKYWVAPMDPTYIRDEPGTSPMGMDLIPVYEDSAPLKSLISIDPVPVQNMGIRTAKVVRRNLSRTIRTVGVVGYQEPKQFTINSKSDGWVERLHINETGQLVKKGQPLLELYSPDLVSAQREFLLAVHHSKEFADSSMPALAESSKRLFDSARRRLKLLDISDRQIARLEVSGEVKKRLTLYAPYDGIVSMKMVREGQFIKRGEALLMLSDLSRIWVYADIYVSEVPWVKVGQQADIILPFGGDKTVRSRISYLYPYAAAETRTVKARLEIDNPDLDLKPDMYVNVRLQTEPVKNALSIPSEAILHSGEKQTVFVSLENGKFEPRRIKIGVEDDSGYTEVRQGLNEGETVVTSAQFMLDSDSRLDEATKKMLEPARAEPHPARAGKNGNEENLSHEEDLFN